MDLPRAGTYRISALLHVKLNSVSPDATLVGRFYNATGAIPVPNSLRILIKNPEKGRTAKLENIITVSGLTTIDVQAAFASSNGGDTATVLADSTSRNFVRLGD